MNGVVCELEGRLVDHEHINLVIVHGEYVGSQEVPCIRQIGKHRYRRRVFEGLVEVDLVLVNSHLQKEFSPTLLASFWNCF